MDDLDVAGSRRVAFVGNKLAEDLFGKGDPVGKVFQLAGSPCTVVGVLKEKPQDSSYYGPDAGMMFIPATTFRALTGRKYVSNIIYQADTAGGTKQVTGSVRRLFSEKLRFDPGDTEAFNLWDTTEEFAFLDTFMTAFRLFLGIVGSLTLVVGGIGVSNIMNVAVEERTHEIGIKMALGARERGIMTQFLLETLLVTGIGGAIGLAISFGVCAIFPRFHLTDYVGDPTVSWSVGALTIGILGVIGLLAGYFPARDASRLDPVVAMKL
ncbi:MAG: FtsX-like permease family protein [Acidobacteriota bacterium]